MPDEKVRVDYRRRLQADFREGFVDGPTSTARTSYYTRGQDENIGGREINIIIGPVRTL